MQVDLDPGDGGADCLAYFLERAEIAALLPDWPLGMNLVVCLDAEGECELVVYHADEGDRILDRVGEVLNRAPQTFAVSPRIEGWPTRRVLFSEERKLMDLVRGAERLCETATDYEINFNFAREEGLDPAEVTRARAAGGLGGLGRPRVRQPDEAAEADGSHRVPPAPNASRGGDALPSGYLWVASGDATPSCEFLSGRILGMGEVIRLAIGPSAIEADVAPVAVSRIAFREDFTRFALPRQVLGADWTPGKAVLVDVPADLFPAVLASRFQRRPYSCHITVSDGGVFILPGNAVEAARRPAPAKAKPAARPRLVTPVRAAGLVLATIGLAAGGLVGAMKSGEPVAEQMARLEGPAPSPAPAEGAMEMLAAFAAADR
ncbi:MAG: hypothetical protein ACU0AT_04535 [Tranquillimonas sp.]|jgi:hypothetical protein